MKLSSGKCFALLLFFVAGAIEMGGASAQDIMGCPSNRSPCFWRLFPCPAECPAIQPKNPKAKRCTIDCDSPICQTVCISPKPSCNGIGSGCGDPRFVGGDGVVFYFHGRKGEHFSLVSDPGLQINARFAGLRPAGRTRDFTWIQALGVTFGSHAFTIEATRAAQWDDAVDHLNFTCDGDLLQVPEGHLSSWKSYDGKLMVERIGSRNSVRITLKEMAEVSLNVVPVTKEDDRIHHYQIRSDDCFVHLEVQFRFFGLSPDVEGVLGRTYRPDYKNAAKLGVAIAVVGGGGRVQNIITPVTGL
ncbi:uncharacterized protein LOC103695811 [Phoenix dactylifera]|uniref:Uncharacterized protein LOC103695811 n=1 Tax=Phoenix dactylifera TaxID=42345 RepID=A0A8B7BFD0_PHODC|nr:uncharacterized protein LOC103695811 [Phoenix dactylifera]